MRFTKHFVWLVILAGTARAGTDLDPRTLNDLGVVYKLQDRPADAAGVYERALLILREQDRSGARRSSDGGGAARLGKLRAEQGRKKEAVFP